MRTIKNAAFGAAAMFAFASSAEAAVDMNAVAIEAEKPVATGMAANEVAVAQKPDGGRVITVTLPGGFKYLIVSDMCGANGCDRLGFIVFFLPSAGDFSFETLNRWNSIRPPQAFKDDEGSTIMAHYVLARGGVPAATLQQNFEFWNDSIISFNNYLANSPKGITVNASAEERSHADYRSMFQSMFEHDEDAKAAANKSLHLPD